MRIIIFVDKDGSAIDRLAKLVQRHLSHFDIKVLPVHPKQPDQDTLGLAQNMIKWADIVDIHYWKTGENLKQMFPTEMESKPKLLCHFNPYDLDKMDWLKYYDQVVVGNGEMATKLPAATLISYGIDLGFFEFKPEMTDNNVVNMVAARIEGKKGIVEVAKACKELRYQLELIGRPSKPEYLQECIEAGANYLGSLDEAGLRESYYRATIHVCNSVDNFESGTLPILEAMGCGTPVLTRSVGHVPDFYDGGNMELIESKPDDIEHLKTKIKALMENKHYRLKLRDRAWKTVKNRIYQKMADEYEKVYYSLRTNTIEGKPPLVSVIIPTFNRPEALVKVLAGCAVQTYKNLEAIVVDSGTEKAEAIINAYRKKTDLIIKYHWFDSLGQYGLAKARNIGAILSTGEVLVFCDDRLLMDPEAVGAFARAKQSKCWLWGEKDGVSKGFVENFSAVKRREFIIGGMFSERMDGYGGMTEEIRKRFEAQGFDFFYVKEAKAKSIAKSGSRWRKKKQIINSKYKLWRMYSL